MKIIEFPLSRASSNNFRTNRSLSPTYLDNRSLAYTAKNSTLHNEAQALARYVLPVPGGPYNKIPLQGDRAPTNNSGNFIGSTIAS